LNGLRQLFTGPLKIPALAGAGLMLIILIEVVWIAARPADDLATAGLDQTEALAMLGIADIAPLPDPPLAQFNEVLKRPLFEPDRRPVPVASANTAAAAAVDLAKTWRLTGVVISGDDSFAMLENIKSGKHEAVYFEGSIDGWKLVEIADERIKFRSAQGQAELSLYRKGGSSADDVARRNGVLVRK
jgi:hypothetical protein